MKLLTMFSLSALLLTISLQQAEAREGNATAICTAAAQTGFGPGHGPGRGPGRHGRGGWNRPGIQGQGRQYFNLGRRGSNVFPTFDAVCNEALRNCVAQFPNRFFGINQCQVVQALLIQDSGQQNDYSQYHGRRLQ